ncbi:MAG: hypothetical protein R3F49_18850 [Planctomycetota bacterium]
MRLNSHLPCSALSACLLMVGAVAQNDECTTAMPISVGSVSFDNTLATTSPELWPCGFNVANDL